MPTRRAVVLGFAAACAAPWPATGASGVRRLTAADVHVNGYPTVEAVRWIGRKLEEETGGRLSIRVYFAGQLGRESDTVELARFGAIDLTRVNFAPLNNPFPLTQLFSLPYVFNSVEHMRRAADGKPGHAVLSDFERRDLVGLAIYDAGSRSVYNTQRPVSTPADLQGLKLRVPPSDIFIRLMRALGANPTPLPYGDVYSALQTRLIDGAENNWRTFHTSRQFEVARFWSGTHHSYSPEALLISQRTYELLAPADRERLRDAAQQSVPYMRELWDRMENESRAHVLAAGVKANDVDVNAFREAAAPMIESLLRRDAQLTRELRAIQALG